ncbi:MAG: lysophospholipid acyltransferase family protein, partial [Deltaproteobacteria bacterium]|nr:lysophospholipid acyltransferase family protein [Deltaproteobacteria bacterium]
MKPFIANIPRRQIISLGRLLGSLLYVLANSHRRLVERNLQFSHPEWSSERISALTKLIFRNAGITLLEVCQLPFLTRKDLLGLFRVEGEEHLFNALRHNKSVIMVSAHMGNWEVGMQFFSCYFGRPFTGVARNMRPLWLDRWLHDLRTRFGMRIIYKKGGLPEMTQTLRRREILGLLVDQSRKKQGVAVMFFGREATATPAAALLAIRCKSTVVPGFCIRDRDGQLTIRIKEPLEIIRTKDLRSDLQTNTQLMTNVVEEMVREYPDNWYWILRPWKTAYPNLYREFEGRRQRRKARRKK